MTRQKHPKSRNKRRRRGPPKDAEVILEKRGRQYVVVGALRRKGGRVILMAGPYATAKTVAEIDKRGRIVWQGTHGSGSSGQQHREAEALAASILTGRPRCLHCGILVASHRRADTLYCSARCRVAANRAKKKK
jgi:hypothetical protein